MEMKNNFNNENYWAIAWVFLFIAFLVSACGTQGPASETRAPPVAPQGVIVEEERIYSPYPRNNGEVPPEFDFDCDYIHFMRYRPATNDESIKAVDAVLVLMPGWMAGNNSLDYLGRQLVPMAEDGGGGSLEVWGIDRRPNCLEDLTGMNAAEAEEDPQIAIDYYWYDAEVEGRTFQGYLTNDDVPFLSEFGLELVMEDIHSVVTAKIPDQDDRKNTVFIGGHSMGGLLTAIYAGWDFDENPATEEDAGFENCAGLIGLDMPVQFPLDPDHPWFGGFCEPISEADYVKALADMRSGAAPRLDELLSAPVAPVMAGQERDSLWAAFLPNEEATRMRELPYPEETLLSFRMIHSRNLSHFFSGVPAFTSFRLTNEAKLAISTDDNFQPSTILQTSLGFLQGGSVVEKTMLQEMRLLLELLLPDWVPIIDFDGLFTPWDAGDPCCPGSGPLYSWANFDEVGNADDPDDRDPFGTVTFTAKTEEVTDIQDVARAGYRGPSNSGEWYFPARLPMDMQAAASQFDTSGYGIHYSHEIPGDFPIMEFLTDNHPNPDPNLSGYNHVDVVMASVDRPELRPNEVFGRLMEFVFDHSNGTVIPLD